jgi:Cu(I)/Ag(I) efflux system membrane fusion protein
MNSRAIIPVLVIGALGAGYVLGRLARPALLDASPAQAAFAVSEARVATARADSDELIAARPYSPEFVKTALPTQETVPQTLPVTGKLALNQQKLRIAAARVAGRLGRIFVFEGQTIHEGEPLAEIYSPDYLAAENELLLARRFRQTLGAGADAQLRQDAIETYQAAVNRLKVLGATPQDLAAIERSGQADSWLRVRAPITGNVIQRNVDPGGYLNLGDPLMSLADLRTLWLYFNVYDADYPRVRLGQTLRFHTGSLPGETFVGRVAFIAPSIDPLTHTLPVRCDIPNPTLRLKPEMFISGELEVGQQTAWVVPRTAVLRIHDQDYVFLQEGERRYRRIAVQGQVLEPDRYAITSGLTHAQPVVVDGAVLLNQALGG